MNHAFVVTLCCRDGNDILVGAVAILENSDASTGETVTPRSDVQEQSAFASEDGCGIERVGTISEFS